MPRSPLAAASPRKTGTHNTQDTSKMRSKRSGKIGSPKTSPSSSRGGGNDRKRRKISEDGALEWKTDSSNSNVLYDMDNDYELSVSDLHFEEGNELSTSDAPSSNGPELRSADLSSGHGDELVTSDRPANNGNELSTSDPSSNNGEELSSSDLPSSCGNELITNGNGTSKGNKLFESGSPTKNGENGHQDSMDDNIENGIELNGDVDMKDGHRDTTHDSHVKDGELTHDHDSKNGQEIPPCDPHSISRHEINANDPPVKGDEAFSDGGEGFLKLINSGVASIDCDPALTTYVTDLVSFGNFDDVLNTTKKGFVVRHFIPGKYRCAKVEVKVRECDPFIIYHHEDVSPAKVMNQILLMQKDYNDCEGFPNVVNKSDWFQTGELESEDDQDTGEVCSETKNKRFLKSHPDTMYFIPTETSNRLPQMVRNHKQSTVIPDLFHFRGNDDVAALGVDIDPICSGNFLYGKLFEDEASGKYFALAINMSISQLEAASHDLMDKHNRLCTSVKETGLCFRKEEFHY